MNARLSVVAAVLLLAGCSAAADAPEPSPPPSSASPSPSTDPTTPEPSPSETVEEVTGPPEQCEQATSAGTDGDPIADAAQGADLPETVTLHLGVQVIDSTEIEGASEVVARICSEPLTDDDLRESATAIARAVYVADAGADITRFVVTSWVPDGDSIQEDASVHVDSFGDYLWESDTAPLDAHWTR